MARVAFMAFVDIRAVQPSARRPACSAQQTGAPAHHGRVRRQMPPEGRSRVDGTSLSVASLQPVAAKPFDDSVTRDVCTHWLSAASDCTRAFRWAGSAEDGDPGSAGRHVLPDAPCPSNPARFANQNELLSAAVGLMAGPPGCSRFGSVWHDDCLIERVARPTRSHEHGVAIQTPTRPSAQPSHDHAHADRFRAVCQAGARPPRQRRRRRVAQLRGYHASPARRRRPVQGLGESSSGRRTYASV